MGKELGGVFFDNVPTIQDRNTVARNTRNGGAIGGRFTSNLVEYLLPAVLAVPLRHRRVVDARPAVAFHYGLLLLVVVFELVALHFDFVAESAERNNHLQTFERNLLGLVSRDTLADLAELAGVEIPLHRHLL